MLLPWLFLAVRETVNFPFFVYVCVGFRVVDDVPSPKFHMKEVGDSVLLSVNRTVNGTFPEVGDPEKAETGVLRAELTEI